MKKENSIAKVLTVIAYIIYIVGVIAVMYMSSNFSFGIVFMYLVIAIVSGTLFLGFAEIIELLNDGNRQKSRIIELLNEIKNK